MIMNHNEKGLLTLALMGLGLPSIGAQDVVGMKWLGDGELHSIRWLCSQGLDDRPQYATTATLVLVEGGSHARVAPSCTCVHGWLDPACANLALEPQT